MGRKLIKRLFFGLVLLTISYCMWEFICVSAITKGRIRTHPFFWLKKFVLSNEEIRKQEWLERRKELLSRDGRKKIMLFAYMRGGSTFFSEMFNESSEVMFWYEPFSTFYSAEFGLKTWSFPQDIFWYQHSFRNSSLRKQEEWELNSLAEFNHNLLSCKFERLPPQLLNYGGLVKSNMNSYQSCLKRLNRKKRINRYINKCRIYSNINCSGNLKTAFDQNCRQKIQSAWNYVSNITTNRNSHEAAEDAFIKHVTCLKTFEDNPKNCSHFLGNKCNESNAIAYKGVRLTMTAVEEMLNRDPDLYVIYLVRDPRGTTASRVKIDHTYRDAKNDALWESGYHCKKMMADISVYNRLKDQYPSSILMMKYEDAVLNPYNEVKRAYDFIGMRVHENVTYWIKENNNTSTKKSPFSTKRSNATSIIDKWRREYNETYRSTMTQYCKDVLLALNYAL